jgi:hypothetical protein
MIQFVCVRDLTGPIIHFEILYDQVRKLLYDYDIMMEMMDHDP